MLKFLLILLLAVPIKSFAGTEYGTWNSPFTGDHLLKGPSYTQEMHMDGAFTYLSTAGPKGSITIVRLDPQGRMRSMTPPEFNVRTRVHEYGGGAFTVSKGTIFASNGEDGALYVFKAGQSPRRLTTGETRFADLHVAPQGLVAIGEHHGPQGVENFLALVNTKSGSYTKLASGHDFYSSPAVSEDGKKIAWICWDNPNMPWTHTQLWVGDFDRKGTITHARQIGGFVEESFFQPQWSSEGILYFVTDRDGGWWNLHRYADGKIENVAPLKAETAEPLWHFDLSTYAFLKDKIVFTFNKNGVWSLALLDPRTKSWKPLHNEGSYIHQVRSNGRVVRFLEEYPNKGEALIQVDSTVHILKEQILPYDKGFISIPHHISYPSRGGTAYAFYYPPTNKNYTLPSDKKPPLIVMLHGGPTAQAKSSFDVEHQFWTSRGFALLDVNYGGSTGYGRHYRSLLDHEWGIVDVEDCVNGALYLVKEGLVDPHKLAIRGGSAGGYTTLAALAFKNVFTAGADYYGVADITALAQDTHKFEKHYMEQLVGKYPEDKALWESRSPLNAVANIHAPLIIFQGDKDPIVPPNQSEMIYAALKQRGIPTEFHLYPGEGHGFKQSKNLISSITREAEFYLEAFANQKTG
jgi:dipeptidyl aminopeptidase/acylaminoacyl peptidase